MAPKPYYFLHKLGSQDASSAPCRQAQVGLLEVMLGIFRNQRLLGLHVYKALLLGPVSELSRELGKEEEAQPRLFLAFLNQSSLPFL